MAASWSAVERISGRTLSQSNHIVKGTSTVEKEARLTAWTISFLRTLARYLLTVLV